MDGFNHRSEAAKNRIGELYNRSEEIIPRREKQQERNKRETAILREYLTCLIGVPEGEERDNRKE